MNRRGFTLVELLAVIAILAILVIIALPNIMSMFNQARKNSFTTELKEIYKVAQQQWISDSLFSTNEKVYSKTQSQSCAHPLDLSGRSNLEYYIRIDKSGKVVEYHASDGSYQYSYEGNELAITDIDNPVSIADLGSNPKISIECDGIEVELTNTDPGDPEQGTFYNVNKGTYYDTLPDAIAGASGRDTIKLLDSWYDGNEQITIPATMTGLTIDLNGGVIYNNYQGETTITNNGKLTIINSNPGEYSEGRFEIYEGFTNNGTLNVKSNAHFLADCDNITNYGTININGGEISSYECTNIVNHGTVNLYDGSIGGNDSIINYSIFNMSGGEAYGYYGTTNMTGGTMNITGGELRGTNNALSNDNGGNITVKDATIYISYPYEFTVISNAGTAKFTNVTVNCKMTGGATSTCIRNWEEGNLNFYSGTIDAKVEAGKYGEITAINNKGTLVFHDGTVTNKTGRDSATTCIGITSSGNTTVLAGTFNVDGIGIEVKNGGTVTMGANDTSHNQTPIVTGTDRNSRGVKVETGGIFNFYDGAIKSKTVGYSLIGDVTNKPTGYIIKKETIDNYETQYLIQE